MDPALGVKAGAAQLMAIADVYSCGQARVNVQGC